MRWGSEDLWKAQSSQQLPLFGFLWCCLYSLRSCLRFLSLSLCISVWLSLPVCLSVSVCLTHSLGHSLTLAHTRARSLPHTHSLTHIHTHTLSLSPLSQFIIHSLTHSLTHSHTLSLYIICQNLVACSALLFFFARPFIVEVIAFMSFFMSGWLSANFSGHTFALDFPQ